MGCGAVAGRVDNHTPSRPRAGAQAVVVECGVNLLAPHRAVATRYDKPALRHQVTIAIATIDTRLRHSWNTT